MAGFKNGKIMLPIKEFLIVKGQSIYELNTTDMTKVTVFYRKYNQEAFLETYKEMPKGDYRINEVGGNKQLEITDLDILDEYYSIQLCRVVDLTSSTYKPSGQIDVITLTQHVNELVDDVKFIFTYLKDVGMVMDSSAGNKILAELKPNTTWFMDENGNMAAMPVNSLFEGFNQLVETLRQQILTLLTQDYSKLSQDLKDETTSLLKSLSDKFDKLVTDSKEILDTYTQGKIQEIKLACDRLLLIAEHKVWKANTIENLKTMDFLQVGDVVEVLGYYTAGDGAGHKRVIASEDDGSGIQLDNGLYANIVHNGEILLTWFGAKDDITYNSINEVKRFFGYMKTNPYCNFIIPEGIFTWNNGVYLPSNITLTINGTISAFDKRGIGIETFDYVTETPGYTGTHDSIITGYGTIDARGNEFPDNFSTPLRIHHCKNITIENITIKNISTYHAIESGGTDGLFIRNVKFKGEFIGTGLQLSNYTIEAIQIEHVTQGGAGGAIPYDNTPTKNVIIEDCYFGASEEGGEMYSCIGERSDSSSLTFENIIIRNNIFDGINAQATVTQGVICTSSNYKNLVITGNQFRNCKGICINQRANTINDGEISNNIVLDNISNTGLKTMRFVNVDNLLIANNIVSNATDSLFWILGVSNQLKVINNLCDNICGYNDTALNNSNVGLALYGSGNGIIIKNNTFSSNSIYFDIPIHIPGVQISKYTNLNIDNNTFLLSKMNMNNYGRYMDRNEEVIYNGGIYNGSISFSIPIDYFNEIDIVYQFGGSILTKRHKITHSNIYGTIQQKDIVIKDFNLDDSNGVIYMSEVHMNINSSNNGATVGTNIANMNGTYGKKTDNTEDGGYIKILKVIGYGKNNRVMINPVSTTVRSISILEKQMVEDGVIDEYNSYIKLLDEYEATQKKELEERYKSYELALQDNPELSYDDFLVNYPMLLSVRQEPQIPESVKKFMDKYLGTTPTPKVETKPRTFSFDEVDKLNDTLKKL